MGRRLEEGKGWRELAVRAGLMHPFAQVRSALLAQRASLDPPRLHSFGSHLREQQSNWRHPLALFSSVLNLDSGVQLSGTHSLATVLMQLAVHYPSTPRVLPCLATVQPTFVDCTLMISVLQLKCTKSFKIILDIFSEQSVALACCCCFLALVTCWTVAMASESFIAGIGMGMVMEALVQGSKVHLDELRLRMSKTFLSPSSVEKCRLCDSAKLALCLASDLQQRNRATLESMIGTKEDGHTASCVLSSDFQSQLAWGVASSHRVGKTWTVFTRFSKDDYAGERLVFQVVHELDAVNKLSTIFAATAGHHPQAGFSWTHEASNKEEVGRSLSTKVLCSGDGNFSLSIKAEFGVIQ